MEIRFYLDEHIERTIAEGLRRRSIDVITTQEAGLSHATDEVQLEYANSERRVLVTRDSDSLALNAAGAPHAGIVFVHGKRRSIGRIVAALTTLHRTVSAEEMVGRVQFF